MKPERGEDKDVEFEFAGYRLDLAARKLTQPDGTLVKLTSRAFDTLAVLVAHRGATLTKRFLLNAVWPDVVVGDNNLNQAVAAIRKALGDKAGARRFIHTVPGRGFCFVADVRTSVAVAALPEQGVTARGEVPSVADFF